MFTISTNEIKVIKEERQRKSVGSVQSLADSICRLGQINPITITRDNVLIAGERRLAACKLLGIAVLARYVEELNAVELQLLELDENIKRSELSWKEQVSAVEKMHNILMSLNEDWNASRTAEYLNYSKSYISQCLTTAKQLDDPRIQKATSLQNAIGIQSRDTDRAISNELNSMFQIIEETAPEEDKSKADIIHADFCKWGEEYTGAKFNLIHCDFPYGIDHQDSAQGNISTGAFAGYGDSEATYWKLITALCKYTDKLTLPSAHLIFWFSMKYYQRTIDFFHANSSWELVTEHPLIWFKSDNKGIVSDVTRRPRNVYETALIFSKGDRKIVSPVANTFACATQKTFHPSEKPEQMLSHFYRLFIDEYTEILDPTCGSGSSIRAAYKCGAARALGLEIDPTFAKEAKNLLIRNM